MHGTENRQTSFIYIYIWNVGVPFKHSTKYEIYYKFIPIPEMCRIGETASLDFNFLRIK